VANDLSRRPWALDTAAVITTDKIRVNTLRWVGATTAGHTCQVEDKNGEVIWSAVATGSNYGEESGLLGNTNFDGFELAVIGSGILYVYYD
jgi:hypothetical protein